MKTKRILTGLVPAMIMAFTSLSVAQATPSRYSVTDLGTLGGNSSSAEAINSSGQVTGASYAPGDSRQHVFLYSGGAMQDLGRLPATDLNQASVGSAINDSGVIVGYGGYFPWRALIWDSANGMRELGVPGSLPYKMAYDINNAGHIIADNEAYYGNPNNAYILKNGSWTQISPLANYPNMIPAAINNHDQVVGTARQGGWLPQSPNHAWIWDEVGPTCDLGTLGGTQSGASDLNDLGDVVGWAENSSGQMRAFLYSGESMQDLGTLGGTRSQATGINLGGQVVGWSYTASDLAGHAFVYNNGLMHDLNDLITPTSGWTLEYASAVNDNGWITGTGINADGQTHAFLLTPVPEPSVSMIALACGLGSLLAFRRR